MKVKAAMKELQERKVSVRHVETMTENIEMTPEAPIHPEPPRVSSSFPPSPQLERATQPAQLPHEVLLQLQVCFLPVLQVFQHLSMYGTRSQFFYRGFSQQPASLL